MFFWAGLNQQTKACSEMPSRDLPGLFGLGIFPMGIPLHHLGD